LFIYPLAGSRAIIGRGTGVKFALVWLKKTDKFFRKRHHAEARRRKEEFEKEPHTEVRGTEEN
jgi:hypothetical protein